jgi:hypothetical protein
MGFGISDERLDKVVMYFTRPVVFYLAAAMCWLWVEPENNFDYADLLWLPAMIALGVFWKFAAPAQANRARYQWLTYYIPIGLAVLGVTLWLASSAA